MRLLLITALGVLPTFCFGQLMTTESYVDPTIQYIESDPNYYNFDFPICADYLTNPQYDPAQDGLYLKAGYGHRYLSSTSTKTDNHGGIDFWDEIVCNGVSYDDLSPVPILCMCDGTISTILNGTDAQMEMTSTGRSVQVTCNTVSQAFGSPVKINYRHLSELGTIPTLAEGLPSNSTSISKGDTIGIMGESGFTSSVHLHLSVETDHPTQGNSFIHTSRIFNPTTHPAVLGPLKQANVEVLHDWSDSLLVRISWPHSQTINRFAFSLPGFIKVFDKEKAYDTGSAIRDNHDCIDGVSVYAYQFNGKQTAQARYINEMNNIPAIYPASPQRDANLPVYGYPHIPITEDSISYVYDFVVNDLPLNYEKDSLKILLSDVWGNTVKATFLDSTLSIGTPSTNTILVYPNPTFDLLQIRSDVPVMQTTIYDLSGKVLSHQFGNNIHLEELENGAYHLLIQLQDGASRRERIIKR